MTHLDSDLAFIPTSIVAVCSVPSTAAVQSVAPIIVAVGSIPSAVHFVASAATVGSGPFSSSASHFGSKL